MTAAARSRREPTGGVGHGKRGRAALALACHSPINSNVVLEIVGHDSVLLGHLDQANSVSKDPVGTHEKFIRKHKLAVRLVSDAEGHLCEEHGVWVEKSMYGRRYMGIERSSFLIDGRGVVREVWRKVKVPGHVEEVLAAVEAL